MTGEKKKLSLSSSSVAQPHQCRGFKSTGLNIFVVKIVLLKKILHLNCVNNATVGDNLFLFGNLPTESFVFVKCIYFFINYMNIVSIYVLLTLEPISWSIFEIG